MTLSPESRAWLHVPPVLSVRAAGGFMRRLGQMKTWCGWEAATVATPSSIFTNWSCCVATIANLTLTYASMLSCWKKNGALICFAMLRFWWRECEMWIYPADLRNISPIKPKMVRFYFYLFIFLHCTATCTICYLYFKDFFEKKTPPVNGNLVEKQCINPHSRFTELSRHINCTNHLRPHAVSAA